MQLPASFLSPRPLARITRRLGGRGLALTIMALLLVGGVASAKSVVLIGLQADGSYAVTSNQFIKSAGKTLVIGERPSDMAFSPDGKHLAMNTTTNTFIVDATNQTVVQKFDRNNRSFAGLTYSKDGTLLAYTNQSNVRIVPVKSDGTVDDTKIVTVTLPTYCANYKDPDPAKQGIDFVADYAGYTPPTVTACGNPEYPGELTFSADGTTLYVALHGTNELGIITGANTATPTLAARVPAGSSPYGAYVSPDGKNVYVANWGGDLPAGYNPADANTLINLWPNADAYFPVKVDALTGATLEGTLTIYNTAAKTTSSLKVGQHPTTIIFNKASTRLFVANGNDDTVGVYNISATPPTLIENITVRPDNLQYFGSMPSGLALSPDEKTLYVANAGNNAVAVVALGTSITGNVSDTSAPDKTKPPTGGTSITGFIPTEWFPVEVATNGTQIFVANNKGEGSINNDPGSEYKSDYAVTGSISFINVPTAKDFVTYNKEIEAYNRYKASMAESAKAGSPKAKAVPVPTKLGSPSVFKHVIYIIKENRTYDQVFGDMGVGNGDPNLAIFGANVSPNEQALARRFGLMDNFYASSVNSADGHQWDGNATTTLYAERSFNVYPSNGPVPDVGSYQEAALDLSPKSIYSEAQAAGLSFRNYGEQANFRTFQKDGVYVPSVDWTEAWRDRLNGTSRITYTERGWVTTLDQYKGKQVIDPNFAPFGNLEITDQARADEWYKDNQAKLSGTSCGLENFQVMQLTNDHTNGTDPSFPTPAAMNADNDLALGRIVDYVSHSVCWKDTVIFVTEDDAQSGVDHVDGHRTVGQVISAYNKRNKNGSVYVNSSLYNETSMLRTMGQILNLAPLNQFDLIAPLMTDMFGETADLTPYSAVPNRIPLDTLNRPPADLSGQAKTDAETSIALPHGQDRADPRIMNPIIWRSVKGPNAPYPHFAWEQTSNYIADPDGDGE